MEEIVGQQNEPPPTTPKAGLHSMKVMFCRWWDWEGVLCYELLLENTTINSKKYCSQLDQLKAALNKKQGISQQKTYLSRYFTTSCFFDDQAKTVTTWLGSSDFSPYSPHIASYVVHLFWSLQNSLTRQNFHSMEDCKRHLQQFFAQKD